jgi:hypothetical protein
MQKLALLAIFSVIIVTSGCANRPQVTYYSDPPGATLYQSGRPMGTTPTTLTYARNKSFNKGQCIRIEGTSVKWASGAEASIAYLTMCPATGYSQQYTFIRPDTPGREIDLNYALQLQRNAIMGAQVAAQQRAAAAAAASAEAQRQATQAQILRSLQPPQQINCESYRTGAYVNTTCR